MTLKTVTSWTFVFCVVCVVSVVLLSDYDQKQCLAVFQCFRCNVGSKSFFSGAETTRIPGVCKPWFPNRGSRLPAQQGLK